MNNRLCTCALLPLIALAVVPVAYYGLIVYFATEQRIACTLTQATNIPYGTISSISMLLFCAVVLAISITKMSYCTVSCLRTTYATWQERNSGEKTDPKD
ncbi:MAG TPA: hypothetical protein VGL94_16460 [Ktedonobacteraceae bacterium]|jgi:hypothetical protein